MTLLEIVNAALGRIGLASTTAVVDNSTKVIVEMLALAQQEGKELSRLGPWKALTAETTFTTVAAAAQTDDDALPDDLDWIIPETMFDRTLRREVKGPLSPQEWQQIQASIGTRVWPAFRIRGTSLLMTPTPTAGNTVAYEYITRNWCSSDSGTGQSEWAADDDTPVLDGEMHALGLIWRWKRAKGFAFAEDLQNYQKEVAQALMREGSRPRITTDPEGCMIDGDLIAAARGNLLLSTDGSAIEWD